MTEDYGAARELLGWAAAGALGLFVAFKRTLRMGATEDARAEHERANESLVKGLRTELERLGKQNGRMAEALNELQNKIAELHGEMNALRGDNAIQAREITQLQAENQQLRNQLVMLTTEVEYMRQGSA